MNVNCGRHALSPGYVLLKTERIFSDFKAKFQVSYGIMINVV
jgi:hypothetical protein